MQKNKHQLLNILALFSLCSPELIEQLTAQVEDSELVAAHLISNLHKDSASICIKSIDDIDYKFNLDLTCKDYKSKGDWLWVKQIDVYFPQELLFSMFIQPKIVDLPYVNQCLCAHWLFKNINQELNQLLESYL